MNTTEYPLRLTKDTRRTPHLDRFLDREMDFPGFEVVQELIGYGDYGVADEHREALAAMAHELEFARDQIAQMIDALPEGVCKLGSPVQAVKDALTKQ